MFINIFNVNIWIDISGHRHIAETTRSMVFGFTALTVRFAEYSLFWALLTVISCHQLVLTSHGTSGLCYRLIIRACCVTESVWYVWLSLFVMVYEILNTYHFCQLWCSIWMMWRHTDGEPWRHADDLPWRQWSPLNRERCDCAPSHRWTVHTARVTLLSSHVRRIPICWAVTWPTAAGRSRQSVRPVRWPSCSVTPLRPCLYKVQLVSAICGNILYSAAFEFDCTICCTGDPEAVLAQWKNVCPASIRSRVLIPCGSDFLPLTVGVGLPFRCGFR